MIDENIFNKHNKELESLGKADTIAAPADPSISESFIVRMPAGTKDKLKAFCAMNHVSMNLFTILAIDTLKDDIEAGRRTVSKLGVKTL